MPDNEYVKLTEAEYEILYASLKIWTSKVDNFNRRETELLATNSRLVEENRTLKSKLKELTT